MDVPRITVHELKALMDKGESITILDVRQSSGYSMSSKKIEGAVYLDPNNDAAIMEFVKTLDKDRPIITYCT
jgi:rhodanese-related sulfurtransferase